ncbi:MAG: aldo/keto reductase [Spirochaetia bacterium]|nr:aldo/keto reductase [Spirochaetia bacterium]
MNYRKLGKTDLNVSEISLGCWTLGGRGWSMGQPNGWADVNEEDAIAAVQYGIEKGVNHFDNADTYGDGRAERLLAKALGKKNRDVIIATKVGHVKGTAEHAYEPAHIRHQCEQSLINLKRDRIDLYYFHHGDFGPGDVYLDDAVAMMAKLKKEGKIRWLGLSAYSPADFLRLCPRIKPDVLQSWANATDTQYIRPGSDVEKLMKKEGMSFVAFSPLAQGLLLGKYSSKNPPVFGEGDHRKTDQRFTAEQIAKLEPKVEKLKERFGREIKDLSRVALQYVLSYDVTGCVIPGFRNKAQVEVNLTAADNPLTQEEVNYIRETFKD